MAVELQFAPVLKHAPELIEGTLRTLSLASQCMALGLAIGFFCAILRVEGPRWAAIVIGSYVEAIRNTPLLVQLFIVFFALPMVGLKISADWAAVLGIGLNLGAYSTEIIRAGILAIPKAQVEAGLALGLSRLQVMRHVVLIPALRIIYPALTSQLTLTLLGTSIASAISASELTTAGNLIESETFRSFETYIVLAAIYICVTLVFRLLYWLIGLVLFRRKRPPLSLAASDPLKLEGVMP